jgi:hypothetical protein
MEMQVKILDVTSGSAQWSSATRKNNTHGI